MKILNIKVLVIILIIVKVVKDSLVLGIRRRVVFHLKLELLLNRPKSVYPLRVVEVSTLNLLHSLLKQIAPYVLYFFIFHLGWLSDYAFFSHDLYL